MKVPIQYKSLRKGDEAIVRIFGSPHSVPVTDVQQGIPRFHLYGIGPQGSDADITFITAYREMDVQDALAPIKERLRGVDSLSVLLHAPEDIAWLIEQVEKRDAAIEAVLGMLANEAGIAWGEAQEQDDQESAARGEGVDLLLQQAREIVATHLNPVEPPEEHR